MHITEGKFISLAFLILLGQCQKNNHIHKGRSNEACSLSKLSNVISIEWNNKYMLRASEKNLFIFTQISSRNMIRPLIILSLLCFTVLSCEKTRMPDTPELDEYGLPVYSETGSNTVAFLLNGEPWVNGRKGGISYSPRANYYAITNDLSIAAQNSESLEAEKIVLRLPFNLNTTKSYYKENLSTSYFVVISNNENNGEYNNVSKAFCKLLKVDTLSQIVSGRFAITFTKDVAILVKIL